jgi:hypothetical protein
MPVDFSGGVNPLTRVPSSSELSKDEVDRTEVVALA